VVHEVVAELCRAAAPDGDRARAEELSAVLAPLIRAMFVESNPVPVKAALSAMGYGTGQVRLPLVPLADESRETVRSALGELELLAV